VGGNYSAPKKRSSPLFWNADPRRLIAGKYLRCGDSEAGSEKMFSIDALAGNSLMQRNVNACADWA
jgi:hypothetical protein